MATTRIALLVPVLAALLALAAPAPAGIPVQIQATGSSLLPCMTVSFPTSGYSPLLEPCSGTSPISRAWTVVKGGASSGSGAAGPIKFNNNQCLDVTGGVDKDGTKVQIYQCFDNNSNQKWQFNADGSIQWAGHNKCLDVTDGEFSGTLLQIWTCSKGNKNQKWGAFPVTPWPAAPKGTPIQFQINDEPNRSSYNNGPCLQVQQPTYSGNPETNGALVVIDECHTTPSYRSWTVANGGSNTGIGPAGPIEVLDGYCLDVKDGIDADGTKLQVWKCASGNRNQQWTVNSDFTIRWAGHNKCVDLTGGLESGEPNVQIWTCGKNNQHQEWVPNPVDPAVDD